MARNDSKEVERLWDTCPIYQYRARDLEYKARFTAITLITSVFFEKCVYHYNIIQRANTYDLLTDGMSPSENETISTKVDHIRERHISLLIALYRGLAEFCTQTRLNYEDLLKTIYIEETCRDIEIYFALEVEINPAYIQCAKEMFLEYWHF